MTDRLARRGHGFAAVGLALAIVLAARASSACAVCTGGANDQTQAGFLLGTLLLSTLPLVLIGALALWIRHRARRLAAEQASEAR